MTKRLKHKKNLGYNLARIAAVTLMGGSYAKDGNVVDWEIHGRELANCNCDYGCPCQFNARPTDGTCEAAVGFQIDRGHHGDVRLDGLRAAFLGKWPGAIHEGNGEMQLVIDESAAPAQRTALERIMLGEDTEEFATMWWVYSTMSPTKRETLFLPIESEIDIEARRGKVLIPGVLSITAEPIRNPVTGNEHRVRIDLPDGFEYRVAEIASGTTRTTGAFTLDKNHDSYAQFAELHLSGRGIIDAAA